jgi:uncharacterized membrane protein YjjB (DUF3815 family)
VKKLRDAMRWSPYPRGTWQAILLNLGLVILIMTAVEFVFGFSWSAWLGALTGIGIVGAVLLRAALRRQGYARTR